MVQPAPIPIKSPVHKHCKTVKSVNKRQNTNTKINNTHVKNMLNPPNNSIFLNPIKKKTTLAKLSALQLRTLWTNTVGLTQITNKTHPKTKADILQEILAFYEKTNWELLPKVKKTNAGKVDLVTIGRSLHDQLINNPIMKTVDCVIIENQISPIANRMKTLQGMLAQHYISLGIPNIEFVSSSNKLKELAPQSGAKTAYKQHKQDGIFYGEKFLKEQVISKYTKGN